MSYERRFSTGVQLRADSQGDEGAMMRISGHAATFNHLSENLGGFREMILPGAFKRSLRTSQNVACLFNHNPDQILGTTRGGTLRVSEDEVGLRFDCDIADTSIGRDLYALVKRGDVDSMSFAFQIDNGDDNEDDDESWADEEDPTTGERFRCRKVSRAKLFDVSPVQAPAYSGTRVNARHSLVTQHSMLDLYPEGIPQSFTQEIRSQILRDSFTRKNTSRQRLMSLILS